MSVKVMQDKKVVTKQTTDTVPRQSAINFVGDIKSEFSKVSWTSQEELKVYTKVVITATFLFGMAVYFMDILIQTTLGGLNMALRMITG